MNDTPVAQALADADAVTQRRPLRRRVAVVLNGAAGALLAQADAIGGTRQLFEAAGLEADFVPSDHGTLPERIAHARDSGADAVVVGGGDGTIACAAQALAGGRVPLGILPLGTMNLMARDLGLPIDDLAAAIRVVSDGIERQVDVGEVNGHVFLCASMLGLPARLARYREQRRGKMLLVVRAWRMAAATLRALRRESFEVVGLSAGAAPKQLRSVSLTIAVNAYDAQQAGRVFARSRLDGGELVTYLVRRLRLADALRLARALATHSWQNDRQIEQQRAPEVVVQSRRRAMRVMNDGEVMLIAPPLRYRVRPRALTVLVPSP